MPAESIRNGAYSAGAVAARRQNGVAVPFRERRLVERLSMRTNHSPGQGALDSRPEYFAGMVRAPGPAYFGRHIHKKRTVLFAIFRSIMVLH
jgi:hypothetical protein